MITTDDKEANASLLSPDSFSLKHIYTERDRSLRARASRLYTALFPSTQTFDRRFTYTALLSAIAGFIFCLLIQPRVTPYSQDRYVASTSAYSSHTSDVSLTTSPPQKTPAFDPYVPLRKPQGQKIIGLVFYGRPMFVNILDCYLQANLARNGGYLDEVHFIANTKHVEDLKYLDVLVDSTPEYSQYNQTGPWSDLWSHAKDVDPEAIFVKIDDDVLFIADDAIPRLVNTLLTHPEAWAVGGHIINSPHSHFWAYHTNTLLPYLAEPRPINLPIHPSSRKTNPANFSASSAHPFKYDWRASTLPSHSGTASKTHPLGTLYDWNQPQNQQLPFEMQRYLPLRENSGLDGKPLSFSARLWQTPAVNASWPSPRGGWTMFAYADEIESWQMGVQTHYSFLEHLENNELYRYHLTDGSGDGIWDMQFERYSLNFMAVKAGRIAEKKLWMNDEVEITMGFTHEAKMPWLVDTRAIVSHFSFGSQHEVLKTDVLARYLGYANEMVCGTKRGGGRLRGWVESSMVRTGN